MVLERHLLLGSNLKIRFNAPSPGFAFQQRECTTSRREFIWKNFYSARIKFSPRMLSRFCFPAGFSLYLFYKGSVLALKSRFHLDYFLNYKSTTPLSHFLKISNSLTVTCDLNFFYFLWGRKVWLSCQSLQNHTLLITLLITLQYLQITHEKCACKCEKVWFFESHFYHTFKVWSHVWSHIYFCMGVYFLFGYWQSLPQGGKFLPPTLTL